MASEARGGRRTLTPSILNLTGVAALLLAVVPLALLARQGGVPAIAEFAPQASRPIAEAPPEQTSSAGRLLGAGGAGATSPSPTPPSAGTVPPGTLVRHCVGDPPRQIEDPQSPPCVPYWHGYNGGATAAGVSQGAINLTVFNADTDNGAKVDKDLQNFFNRYFEFYGRQIHVTPATPEPGSGDSCPNRQAEALNDKTQQNPFAVFGTTDYGAYPACYAQEATKLGMIQVQSRGDPEAYLDQNSPYLWRYAGSFDSEFRAAGEWICKALAGQTASFSQDPMLRSRTRRFGVVVQTYQNHYQFDGSAFREAMAACDQPVVEKDITIDNTSPDGGDSENFNAARNALIDLKTQGVTTIYCYCQGGPAITTGADADAYYPEWIVGSAMWNELYTKVYWTGSDQRRSLIMLSSYAEQVPYADDPTNWALAAADNGYQIQVHSQDFIADREVYETLLLVASGLQMAGPGLTPRTFQHALQTTAFPNPFNWIGSGRVGFPGGYNMIQDFTIAWWSDAAVSPYRDDGSGTWCYAVQGRRWPLGQLPASTLDLFQACTTYPPTANTG